MFFANVHLVKDVMFFVDGNQNQERGRVYLIYSNRVGFNHHVNLDLT